MDWLDEQLQRVRLRNRSLQATLLLYLLFGLLFAILAYMFTVSFCVGWERLILNEHQSLEHFTDVFFRPYTQTVQQEAAWSITILQGIRRWNFIFYLILAIAWSSIRFYQEKIRQPLLIMEETIRGIQKKDLSISCHYKSGDELEQLCSGVEELRKQLVEDQRQIVQFQREQRQVNAAFAHDIRTPLAVIQSNVALIRLFQTSGKMTEEGLYDSLNKIDRHIERLQSFTFTMQEIQKIDEIDLVREYQETSRLIQAIKDIGQAVIDKEFQVEIAETVPEKLSFDLQIISQVIENLLLNANRFAEKRVAVTLQVEAEFLLLFVHDDGKGFSKEEITKAALPYYSRDKKDHFGMGLTICQTLTQKHGGVLKLSNAVNGGAVTSATFNIM
ncbi:sensor histidine kinase [Enterococcus sp. BWR-S5]|uniref:sensor histidine kinase n=1 Tax=Enterococcus sp. BWR-S5 TaxID=2787714 RepID=UPI0019221E4F|nr:HAMP domain-containing sensor histidine kinase [Enterococcus sp. BWR-S5]MBL1226661.1 HAMP domain-containing histidine kinase [Enterococcus sp. BWR-S5]